MAKAKVITALALTTVMLVVMTGLAAADEPDIDSCDVSGGDTGNTIYYPGDTVCVKGINFGSNTYSGTIYVVGDQGATWFSQAQSPLPDKFKEYNGKKVMASVSVNGWDGSVIALGTVGNGAGQIPHPTTEGVYYYYDIVFDVNDDGWDPNSSDMADKEACIGFRTAIPEFATIAIPAVAVLGLFLFYSRRKRKEE